MNRESIITAQSEIAALLALGALSASVQANPQKDGRPFVVLPDGSGGAKVEYLERPSRPARKSGNINVDDADSFIMAANRHTAKTRSVLYASLHPASFTAVLNDHQEKPAAQSNDAIDAGADWRDHRVIFALTHSKEWDLWFSGQKKDMAQEDFAFFIENNMPDFKDPEGARMLEIALNFRVKNNVAFRSALKLQDGSVDLQYTEQVEGGAGRTGNTKVPETFKIEIPVWAGLDAKAYVVEARLRYRVGNGVLAIRYELVRSHKVVEKAFGDVLDQIKKGVKDAPIVFGKAG